MEQKTVEAFAKKSLAFLKNATKSGVAAVSQSIDKVRKGYATKHEESVMNELRAKGLHPAEHLHAGLLQPLFFLLSLCHCESECVLFCWSARVSIVFSWVYCIFLLYPKIQGLSLLRTCV